MISSVLWDMDGVLVETSEAHYQSWLVAFEHFGFQFNRKYFRRYYGMNDESTIRGVIPGAATPELIHKMSEYKEYLFRENIRDQIQLLPGVLNWLELFNQSGYRQAVASSGPYENIELTVNITGIKPYFIELVSCADGPTKPDPWVFLEAARRIHSPAGECLVIEDTPNGIKAAKQAGMHCLAVTTSNPASTLTQADLVIKNLGKLNWDVFKHHFL